MQDDEIKFMRCPECNRVMHVDGVLLMGNFLLDIPEHPVWKWVCDLCLVIVAEEMDDQNAGWELWFKQNPGLDRRDYGR